tara:strand:+ start:10610 stop:11800 length:1191 start_codon:yes stop_codon:yes gene_type:complete
LKRYKKTVLSYLIIIFIGCTAHEEHNVPEEFKKLTNLTVFRVTSLSNQIFSFQKDVVYGDSKDRIFGNQGSVIVDSSGRVFIADLQNKVINVFESGGKFITQLGREGRGPNEFTYIKSLQIRHNRLYAFDSKQNKVNIYSLDNLTALKTTALGKNRSNYSDLKGAFPEIVELFVVSKSAFIAKFKSDDSKKVKAWQNFDFTGLLFPLDSAGNFTSDRILDYKMATGTQIGTSFSNALIGYHLKAFFGNTSISLSSDNYIYLSEPNEFLIKVYNSKGVYKQAFYYPFHKIPLTQESAIEAKLPELYLKNWELINAPEYWPVITDMKIDDQNRLWVAVTVEDMNVYEWWVLEPSGEMLTKFTWPRDKPIQQIRNGYLYTKEKDEEGADIVVRYSIVIK